MPRKYPQILLVWLCSIAVSGCRDHFVESLLEPPALPFAPLAFMTDPGDAFVLLATTNSGKLLEIDVDAGAVRLLGQSQTFEGFKPGWTGITSDAATVFTSSRRRDDIRDDGCSAIAGHTPCTHLYTIDPGTGLVTADRGSTGKEFISDIDISPVTGTMFGSRADAATSRGQLVTIDKSSAIATTVGTFFSTPTTVPSSGGFWMVNGGLSVHPSTGTIWGIESGFHWVDIGPRLFTIDGSTGEVASVIQLKTVGGNKPQFGFDGLEIMPDGRFFASRGGDGAGFEIYEINPTTGTAALVSLTIPKGLGRPNGLETTTAPRALALAMTAATMSLDPGELPGGDDFSMDATFALGAGNNGLDLTNEAFLLGIGDLGFTLPAGSFSLIGGVFKYASPGPGLTLVHVDEGDGTLRVEGDGLTLTSLVGGPVAVNLQMGDDQGETTATFSAPGGIPPQPGGEFYSVTNQGELLIIDLGAETGTLVGKAGVGWTGLAFSSDGRLFTSSRVKDGSTSDGCLDGWFLRDGKCAHVYQVDPLTGGIVTHVGNTGIEFLSDLQFGTDGLLLGSEFINEREIRDGGLVKIDLATGLAAEKGTFGTFDAFVVGNGGLALHPITGQLWGIEANDLRPRLFKIDAVTGAASPPVTLLQNGRELEFGLDGLGILENGNFYATRGSGFQEVYRIDAVTGEVRLQNLTLDSSIKGGLNGLDIFVEPSGAPPPPAEIGVSDTFLRKDKSKKSKKSKRTDNRHTNEGGNPRLELAKDQDVLVAFDVGDLDFSTVTGARLILTIDPSYGSTGWGSKGGKAEIKYLETDFVEGNGINTGPVDDRVRGTGAGATNECAADTDIANNARDCAKEDRWKGAKDRGKRSDRVDFTDGILGTLSFDVTADLRNGRTRWVIDVKGSKKKGSIVFFSKEGAALIGDFSFEPRLAITTGS